jgi:AbrB family looped-hinge helix DNA binding protein
MTARTIRMSSKGQIVVPREVREKRGWKDGTVLEVLDTARGLLLRRAAEPPDAAIDALVGCISYRGPVRTVAEMEQALFHEARRRGTKAKARRRPLPEGDG